MIASCDVRMLNETIVIIIIMIEIIIIIVIQEIQEAFKISADLINDCEFASSMTKFDNNNNNNKCNYCDVSLSNVRRLKIPLENLHEARGCGVINFNYYKIIPSSTRVVMTRRAIR